MKRIILKLGGSVITKKNKNLFELRGELLKLLCKEIKYAVDEKEIQVVIVHGAGPFGHIPAKEYKLTEGGKTSWKVHGMALTHQNMEKLNSEVIETLIEAGLDAITIQPSAITTLKNGEIVDFPVGNIKHMLNLGLTPVLYGDVSIDLETDLNILSGDKIVPYLAEKLEAQKVVVVTSFNGIFDKHPNDADAKKIDVIDGSMIDKLSSRDTEGTDVTGGIHGKVGELLELAKHGITSEIIGCEKDYLKRTLMGEQGIGTHVK